MAVVNINAALNRGNNMTRYFETNADLRMYCRNSGADPKKGYKTSVWVGRSVTIVWALDC